MANGVDEATAEEVFQGLAAFAGFGFWIFCFAMSRYSQRLERRLQTGHKH